MCLFALLAHNTSFADLPSGDGSLGHIVYSPQKLELLSEDDATKLSDAIVFFWSQFEQNGQSATTDQVLEHGPFRGQLRIINDSIALHISHIESGQDFTSSFTPLDRVAEFSQQNSLRFDPRSLGVARDLKEIQAVTEEVLSELPQKVGNELDSAAEQTPEQLRSLWRTSDLEVLQEVLELGAQLHKKWMAYLDAHPEMSEEDFIKNHAKKGSIVVSSPELGQAELNFAADQYFIRVMNQKTQEVFMLHTGLDPNDAHVQQVLSRYKIASGMNRPDGQVGRDVTMIELKELGHPNLDPALNPEHYLRFERHRRFVTIGFWADYWRTIKSPILAENAKFGTLCGSFQGMASACAAGIKRAVDPTEPFRWEAIVLSFAWGSSIGSVADLYKNWVSLGSEFSRTMKSTGNGLAFAYTLMAWGLWNSGNLHALVNFDDAFWPTVMLHLATIGPSIAHNWSKTQWANFAVARERVGITRGKTWKWRLWPTSKTLDTGFKETLVDNQIRFYLPSFFLRLVDWFSHTHFSWYSIVFVMYGSKWYVAQLAKTTEHPRAIELSQRLQKQFDQKMLSLFGADEQYFRLKLRRLYLTTRMNNPLDRFRVDAATLNAIDRELGHAIYDPEVQIMRLRRFFAWLSGDTEWADAIGQELNARHPSIFQFVTTKDKQVMESVKFRIPSGPERVAAEGASSSSCLRAALGLLGSRI